MNNRLQHLGFYPLRDLADVDFKIKEMGQYWRRLNNITISYTGGAYYLEMDASEPRQQEE